MGRASDGTFGTARLKEFPPRLNRAIAEAIEGALDGTLVCEGPCAASVDADVAAYSGATGA
eukprot:3927071-Lingulodinium_polyedra.AAC.1